MSERAGVRCSRSRRLNRPTPPPPSTTRHSPLARITPANAVIQGNLIGTNVSGSAAIPNVGHGVELIGSANATIGGTTVAARNVISGNDFDGIAVGSSDSGTVIQGNYVGFNSAGRFDVGL